MLVATLTGNIGKDAEVREYEGRKFVTFSVAVNETKKGEQKTTWVSVSSPQENLAAHLKKGKQVMVIGKISVSIYNNEPQIDCNASFIELLGKKEEEKK